MSLLDAMDADMTDLTRYDVKARFWLPKLQQGKGEYQLYFLPTRITVVPGPFLKNAIMDAYNELGNDVFKISMTHPNEIKERNLCRIGHNFFGLFGEHTSASSVIFVHAF
jgi:hypothetical protein